jgi:hypothetical protein
MATYDVSTLADSAIAHKKGITLQQGRALRDNPIAIAEGAAGAPRIALHVQTGVASAVPVEFETMENFGGVVLHFFGFNGSGSAQDFTVALSDNDTTYSTALTIVNVSNSTDVQGVFFVDFSTGAYNFAGISGTVQFTGSGTMTTPSGDVTAIRATGASSFNVAIMAMPNGGRSTT